MDMVSTFEISSYQTTIVSLTGDSALVSVTGHDSHPNEGDNANYAYSSVSTSALSSGQRLLNLDSNITKIQCCVAWNNELICCNRSDPIDKSTLDICNHPDLPVSTDAGKLVWNIYFLFHVQDKEMVKQNGQWFMKKVELVLHAE